MFIKPAGSGSGGGTPGGSNLQLQYNNSGLFGGITGVETDGTSIFLKNGSTIRAYNSTNTTAYPIVGAGNIGVETLQLFGGRLLWVIGGNTLAITDPSGTAMQTLALNRNVNTANTIGSYNFTALNASFAPKNYAELTAEIVSGTAGAESGKWNLRAISAGTVTTSLEGNGTGINIPHAGAVGSPSVTVNSTNSGFYASTTNGVALSVAGTQVWRTTSGGGQLMNLRFQLAKGSNVASATSMGLGAGGNLFQITGSTTISRISSTNWTDGSEVTLRLPSGITIEHMSASGSGAQINLTGATNLTTTAVTYLHLLLDGGEWIEMYRRVL